MGRDPVITTAEIERHTREIRAEAEAALAMNDDVPRKSDDGEIRIWPVLSSAALYGLSGEIVRSIEPHTEADNAALLIQLLAGFGNLIGKTAHFRVGGDFHFTKVFAVLVGATASGRKGTSWAEIERLLVRVDPSFRSVIQNGLSSGEGLIHHVRDKTTAQRTVRGKDGKISEYQEEIVDAGAQEKRAFVIEPEFVRVLKVMSREGNTLSSVIRQSWDTDFLSVMTKNPLRATEAHISIVGHITEMELIRGLRDTETANGFANRFLWFCVKRSKYLPNGGDLRDSDLNGAIAQLQRTVSQARITRELRRDAEADELWRESYKPLSDGFDGLLGSVTSRATAQVMRLACLYALFEACSLIRVEHMKAALALWKYCEDSARYVFGTSSGDKLALKIEAAIRERRDGLCKTEINELFGRHKKAVEVDRALAVLVSSGKIERHMDRTAGRSRTCFRLVREDAKKAN